MKEIPILYATPMVAAILEDKKTMTRRAIKLPPDFDGRAVYDNYPFGIKYSANKSDMGDTVWRLNPRWEKDDILWVRETHYAFGKWVRNGITKTNKPKWKFVDLTIKRGHIYRYATHSDNSGISLSKLRDGQERWYKRPSIFMPKAACRIFLKVADVRAEKLHDTSQQDAIAEGVHEKSPHYYRNYLSKDGATFYCAEDSFRSLWISINGQESWDANPWVWVIAFEKVAQDYYK